MSEFILKHGSGFTLWRQNCSLRYCGHLVRCLSWRKTGLHCLMDLPGLGGFWLFSHWARNWRWECYPATFGMQIVGNQFSYSFFLLFLYFVIRSLVLSFSIFLFLLLLLLQLLLCCSLSLTVWMSSWQKWVYKTDMKKAVVECLYSPVYIIFCFLV